MPNDSRLLCPFDEEVQKKQREQRERERERRIRRMGGAKLRNSSASLSATNGCKFGQIAFSKCHRKYDTINLSYQRELTVCVGDSMCVCVRFVDKTKTSRMLI